MTKQHEVWLQRAIDLAKRGKGHTSPNPVVGAVVVQNNHIIGEGWHRKYGSAHAEVNAIESVQDKDVLPLATLYVTLEPCFHYGKTPPCVDLVLRHKIPHVVVGCTDPNPLTAGKSIEKLRQAGVKVTEHILEAECMDLIRTFRTNILHQRPYIQLKWAQTADGFIGKKDEPIWISNDLTKRLTHKWRSEADAILVGTNTILTDNPRLDNRLYIGKSPIRVVLDRIGKLKTDLSVFDGAQKTILITENEAMFSQDEKYEVIKMSFEGDFLPRLLSELYSRKIGILMVEGGATLLNSFMKANIWDEAQVFIGENTIREGIAAPRLFTAPTRKVQLMNNEWVSYDNMLCRDEALPHLT
jgi:diaminohydroxyphosphoribosylaminopyrimidine deaminase / 5-amino-6-(5-phosphoribosylamino)uracil reductase